MFGNGNNNSSGNIRRSNTINFDKEIKSPIDALKFRNNKPRTSFGTEETALKRQKFEAFLSYRKYLSRLALAQSLQFYETFKVMNPNEMSIEEEVNEVYRVIIFFYKKVFFPNRYGENKKNKKLEEKFVRLSILNYLKNKDIVDSYIKSNINKKWCLSKLNSVIRASLRSAICEALYSRKVGHKIIVNEYTDIIANSVSTKKEIDFFNAVLDSILKQISIDYA